MENTQGHVGCIFCGALSLMSSMVFVASSKFPSICICEHCIALASGAVDHAYSSPSTATERAITADS